MSDIASPRFPDEVSAWMVGGPEFKTMIFIASGGDEQRNSLWQYPKCKWDISAGLRTVANASATIAFHRVAGGRANAFRIKDPVDYTVAITEGVCVAITSNTAQLYKKYTLGSNTALRKIVKPIATGFVLKNNGVAMTVTTDYTLDAETGIVTAVGTPPNAGNLTWSGTFDVRARFDDDWLQIGLDPGGLLNYNGIIIQELR